MNLTRRQATALYHKRKRKLEGITGAIHPYEVIEDEVITGNGSKYPAIIILTHQDIAAVVMKYDDDVKWMVKCYAAAMAKELSIQYYMENGDEDMR